MNKESANPYALPPSFSDNPGNRRKQALIENDQRRRLEELTVRPPNIAFFEERLAHAVKAPKPRPRIGILCNVVPPEIILAAGADPVRLDCGNSAAAVAGEEMLAGDICPLAKATVGMFMRADALPATCDAFVIPATCDAKRKLAEVLADYGPVFHFPLPNDKDVERHAESAGRDLKRMADFARGITGQRISRRGLLEAIELVNRRSDLVHALHEAHIANSGACSIRDLFVAVQSSVFSPEPLETWLPEAEKLRRHISDYRSERRDLRQRVILTGAPLIWPNFKPLNVLEECGALVMADTLCSGLQSCVDPVVLAETGLDACYRALAARYIFGSLCPCFASQTTRLNRVLDLVEKTRAEGVVQYALRLCQPFDIENYRLERVLKSRRIPFLNLRTDYSLEDTEQLRVRIEAFLETL